MTDFLKENNIKRCSCYTSLGGVLAENFERTIDDLLKKLVFERRDANLIDILSIVRKQYKNRNHSSTNLTPIQASLKKMKDMFTTFH